MSSCGSHLPFLPVLKHIVVIDENIFQDILKHLENVSE